MSEHDIDYQRSAARIFDPPAVTPHDITRCNWGLVAAGDDVTTHRCSCGGFEGNSLGAVKHSDEACVTPYTLTPFPRLRMPDGYTGPRL